MNKFTRYLENEKKAPTAIDARNSYAKKVYHTKRELIITQIALFIAVIIIIISVIINLILYPISKSSVKALSTIDQTFYLDGMATELEHIEKSPVYETMPICSSTATFKSWMDYRMITSTSSRQWEYRQLATTDENGFRRIGDYYMVAMAKQYGPVGTKYYITFSGGSSIYAMIGDVKGATQCQHPDSSMLEFIIDTDTLLPIVRKLGNANIVFEGSITEIRIIK